MYQCEKALVKHNNSMEGWEEVDVRDTPIISLFDQYSRIYLVLKNTTTQKYSTIYLNDLSVEMGLVTATTTVTQWLTAQGNRNLGGNSGVPKVTSKTVKYNDAWQAGYKLNLNHAFLPNDSPVTDADKADIHLAKSGVDYKQLYDNCLFTVNGLVHLCDRDDFGVYIKDGGRSFFVANDNHVGILSFREVGTLKFIPITEEMIYTPHVGGKLGHAAYLKLPENIGNRTVLLVIGGYLHLLDRLYQPIGERSVKINFADFPLMDRLMNSRHLIDISKVTDTWEQNEANLNPTHVAVSDLYSDASIKAYLTLSQSFVVILDNDNLYVEKHRLESAGLPGRYRAYSRPEWPLRTELGRLPEYLAIPESDIWSVAIQDNFTTNYRYETARWQKEVAIDGSALSANPVFYTQGHLLEIGSDVVTFVEPT